ATKLTHQTTPSRSNSAGSSVAKCSATSGEYVQSSSRVGSPRCCASASQSQIESALCSSPRAYFLKFLRSATSRRRTSSWPSASRSKELDRLWFASESPRKAKGDRNRLRL